MNAFTTATAAAKKSYFDDKYKTCHCHLRILATHPDFQRRGAASALCRWGMENARERGVPVTVLASPMGEKIYGHLGFQYLGSVPVQVEGEEGKLSIGCWVYHASAAGHEGDPPSWKVRGHE